MIHKVILLNDSHQMIVILNEPISTNSSMEFMMTLNCLQILRKETFWYEGFILLKAIPRERFNCG